MNPSNDVIPNKNNNIDLAPSDFKQAVLRFSIVSGLLIWSIYQSESRSVEFLLSQGFVVLTLVYWCFSIGLLISTKRLNATRLPVNSTPYRISRAGSVVADISAISAYTATAGSYGLILYPIYLQTIIGHGYRYGIKYFYLSISLGLIGFSVALTFNRMFAETSLVIAYYLGLLLVPFYSLLLLRMHEDVKDKLKYVNESRSRFIANMSHELRTPLHAILSLNEVLREDFARGSNLEDGADEKLRMVNESAQHLLSLVNRVLDIASSDQNKEKEALIESVDIRRAISRATNISAGAAFTKRLPVNCYVSPLVPIKIETSGEFIEEILINILGNAVKYTDQGGVTIHTSVLESNQESPSEIIIRIVDSGVGIKPELLPYIFEPFTMGDDASARRHNGTGLGLTITKQYIETLGGSVSIDSALGTGSAVEIRLPLKVTLQSDAENTKEISALIIAASDISPSERLLFKHYHYDVVTMPLDKATALNFENEKLDMVFVSAEYSDKSIEIKNLKSALTVPLISYSADMAAPPEIGNINSDFISTVRPAIGQDMLACRSFLHDAQLDVDNLTDSEKAKFRILVADDNEINRATAKLALESAGHTVDLVSDGESALEALAAKAYNLVLMDMHMPNMSGVEAAKLYSFEAENRVPIILLTADVTDETRQLALEADVAALITKPILPNALRTTIQKYALSDKESINFPHGDISPAQPIAERVEMDTMTFNPKEIQELISCGASNVELIEMVDMFESDTKASLSTALKAAKENQYSVIHEQMHSIRGAAGTMGATGLEAKAYGLESREYAKDGIDFEQFEEVFNSIEESSLLLRRELESGTQMHRVEDM